MAKKNKNKAPVKELTIKQKQHNLLVNTVIECIFMSILSFYITINYCAYKSEHIRDEFGDLIAGTLSEIAKNPLYFIPINYDIGLAIAIPTLIVLFMFVSYTYNRLRVHQNTETLKGRTEWIDSNEIIDKYAETDNKGNFKEKDINYLYGNDVGASLYGKKPTNTLILGTTGSGKSYGHVKPNLLQMNSCFVTTDPSGDLTKEVGECLRRFGYRIRIFDINDMKNCDTYNPLKYCKTEADVKVIVDAFIESTDKTGGKGGSQDPFWDDSMNAFLCAMISLLSIVPEGCKVPYAQMPEIMGEILYSPCFSNLTELTRLANRKYPGASCGIPLLHGAKLGDGKNATSNASIVAAIYENIRMFEANRQECDPEEIVKPYTMREWENFTLAPEKTATTILMTTAVRLDSFNIEQVKNLTSTDTIHLEDFGNQKDALFMIIPSQIRTYDFLASFLYTQLFNILYHRGEYELLDTKNLFVGDEFLKHFTKEDIETGRDIEFFENTRDAKILRVEGKGKVDIGNGKIFDDAWYEVVGKDGSVITRRPTEELAKEFVHKLKDAKITPHKGKALPMPIRFMLDEFKNTGKIPGFLEKLATIRKYNIACTIICQNLSQLKGMYPDDWSTIDGNCPFFLFLGGDDNETTEYVSKKIGNETVKGLNNSIDNKKVNMSYNVDGRELLRPEDVGRIDYTEELLMIYGEQPYRGTKFDYVNHKRYKYTFEYANEKACRIDRTKYGSETANISITLKPMKPSIKPEVNPFSFEEFRRTMCAFSDEDAYETYFDNMNDFA